jgi:insecticidal toxin complex protein TccC
LSLPATNQAKQQTNTLHIGTYILSENSKNNTQSPNQTRYQLPKYSNLFDLPYKH